MAVTSVSDIDVKGKRVLVRVDFNTPLENGHVTDDTRIRASLPTISLLLARGAAVILMSHLGRPKGKASTNLSLAPVARRLSELLGQPVPLAPDCIGPEVERMARALQPGQLLLLENLRFHPEEEADDPGFARDLASLAAVYVNDAFGTAHRAHASVVGVAHDLPAAAGLLMQREIDALTPLLKGPKHPYVAVIGGAKVSSKLAVLRNLLPRVDRLLIGGGMACTFLKAKGLEIGRSLVEDDQLDTARALLHGAGADKIMLPTDAVIAEQIVDKAETRTVSIGAVPADWRIADIGPETVRAFSDALRDAATVLWNGPMGVFEIAAFATGSIQLAHVIADLKAVTVVGGGDTVAAVELAGVADKMTHVSTGGGASLEFLEGRTLPGLQALEEQ